ncbi:SDR family oxidoreductase [Singulisphaera sp. PoT]|uniref:SDR family oxidoreductase n=1 Tax=Singulisphaera sp. PoT TaxID=3411797 RepID=UPI003BF4E8C6
MTTLIVGCGYLGQVVGRRLIASGERVLGTVRSPERAAQLAELGIEPQIADVLSAESLQAIPDAERIVYCVGFDRKAGASMRSVYVDGLRAFLDARVGRYERLVYASSTGVYGQSDGSWVTEDSPAEPTHESGQVCLDAEKLIRAQADASHSAVVLRFAGLYGPGRIVRRAALCGGEPIAGDPEKFLNLVHIDDAAQAVVAALDAQQPEACYLVCDDRPVHRGEYYGLAASLLDAPPPRFETPAPGSPEARRDASNKRISNRRLRQGLGVDLIYPDITTGLADALR